MGINVGSSIYLQNQRGLLSQESWESQSLQLVTEDYKGSKSETIESYKLNESPLILKLKILNGNDDT